MKTKLKQKILVIGLDFVLSSLVLFGNIFSFKGFLRISLILFLSVALGKGYQSNSSPKVFSFTYPGEYVFLSSQETLLTVKKAGLEFPEISAKSALVVDLVSGQTLYEKNADLKLAPASTTKLMTALVSQDLYIPTDVLEVPLECAGLPGMNLGLFAGEKFMYLDLLNAALISSSNDVACTLAGNFVSQEEFVELMNKKALKLNLTSTNFTNPVGFDDPNSAHLSTARDLFRLAIASKKDPILRGIFKKKFYTLSSGKAERTVYTTNRLLWSIPETVGIKTGTTFRAGQVLIYEYKDLSENKDLMIILMRSSDRFGEIPKILEWVSAKYVR